MSNLFTRASLASLLVGLTACANPVNTAPPSTEPPREEPPPAAPAPTPEPEPEPQPEPPPFADLPECHYPSTVEDGTYPLEVALDDRIDSVEVRLTSPEGEGPFPVFVWLHGQGFNDIVNCGADRHPFEDAVADWLVPEGFIVAELVYRNEASTVEVAPNRAQPFRDDLYADPAAALEVAIFANHHVRADPERRTVIGGGSWGARVTVSALRTEEPALTSRQRCIDLRTAVINAGTGARYRPANGSGPPEITFPTMYYDMMYGPLFLLQVGSRAAALTVEDLAPNSETEFGRTLLQYLRPRMVELVRRTFFERADPGPAELQRGAGLRSRRPRR